MVFRLGDVSFRTIEERDLEHLQFLFNNEQINRNVGRNPLPVSMHEQRAWFFNLTEHEKEFRYMVENEVGDTIGMAVFGYVDPVSRIAGNFGNKIFEEYSGRGYGKLVDWLKAEIIFLHYGVEVLYTTLIRISEAVVHMMAKSGQTLDCELRGNVYKGGTSFPQLNYSMTRDEYLQAIEDRRMYNSQTIHLYKR